MRPAESDRLVETADTLPDAQALIPVHAAALRKLGLASQYGVFISRVPHHGWGIYVGRHHAKARPEPDTAYS